MNVSWYEGLIYGLVSGLAEILPVSAQAHRFLLLKLFGGSAEPELMRLLSDLGILAALYYACQNHIIRIIRAKRLSRVPKRRRKRPLDTRSLMDLSLLKTMAIPVILVFFLYGKIRNAGGSMILIAVLLFVNGVILYAPQFFPGGNRDSRNMSRVHGLLIGLGGAAAVVPGISGMAASNSVSSVCGVDRGYGLNMTLMLHMLVTAGFIVYDFMGLVSVGLDNASFVSVLICFLSALASFGAATAGIKILRLIAAEIGYSVFAYYCWGVALFTFIMNLVA